MATLLSVAIALILGLMMTRVFKRFKLPAVTSYLVAGVIVGPFCLGQLHIGGLGFVSADAVSSLSLVSEVALGFIAFSIGNEFRLKDLKAMASRPRWSASCRRCALRCWWTSPSWRCIWLCRIN